MNPTGSGIFEVMHRDAFCAALTGIGGVEATDYFRARRSSPNGGGA
jgi:hypothetical protein